MPNPSSRFLVPVLLLGSFSIAQTLDEGPTDGSFVKQGTVVDYNSVGPTDPNWEAGYQARVGMLVNAKTWPISVAGGQDVGKSVWPALLAELYKVRDNAAEVQKLINGAGQSAQDNANAGSFTSSFSDPGYTLYYLTYYDKLSAAQRRKAEDMVNSTGFNCMMRLDGKMDPIYDTTEKNSEGFNWMSRLSGYLWAQKLNNAGKKAYFDAYVKNWIRNLYNTERVEWNSTNYFGYTFIACLVLYERATDPEVKKRAKAALDWQVINLATHWMDGAPAGPDVRAKDVSYRVFDGSQWVFGYLYFADPENHPSYSKAAAQTALQAQINMCGYIPYSSYRPPQVALDIAHRKFTAPVELHSAKPYYHADFNNYEGWKGNQASNRRFDFETLYMDKNYTLGSTASNYPAGIDCFYEFNPWRLRVKGTGNGGAPVFGNAAGYPNSELSHGRSPYEEIGQYRNVMMRLIKGGDALWAGIPNNIPLEWSGNTAFADMGTDVYLAFMPINSTSKSSGAYPSDNAITKCSWNFSAGTLGALVLEIGTKAEHGSFASFKTAIGKTTLTTPQTDQIEYTSTGGRKLKLEYQPVAHNYAYWKNTAGQPSVRATLADAGVPPKVWCDGQYLDFGKWQSWHVTGGDKLVEQNWGSGALTAWCNGKGLQIIIDPVTANVEYRSIAGSLAIAPGNRKVRNAQGISDARFINDHTLSVDHLPQHGIVGIFTARGKLIAQGGIAAGSKLVAFPQGIPDGIYFYRVQGNGGILRK